ncbi:MAG TPA: hypothetical protein VMR31_03790 [Myxococcota bacterium]|nr:hypothetical protein [Myxococcota bacterium]
MSCSKYKLARAAALLLAVTLSCQMKVETGSYPEQKALALAALDTFHARFAAADYEAIWADSTDGFRSHPKDELIAQMKDTAARWGKPGKAHVMATSCFPKQVRLLVEAEFEKGSVGEVLVWNIDGQRALLHQIQWFAGPVRFPDGATNECRSPG